MLEDLDELNENYEFYELGFASDSDEEEEAKLQLANYLRRMISIYDY